MSTEPDAIVLDDTALLALGANRCLSKPVIKANSSAARVYVPVLAASSARASPGVAHTLSRPGHCRVARGLPVITADPRTYLPHGVTTLPVEGG